MNSPGRVYDTDGTRRRTGIIASLAALLASVGLACSPTSSPPPSSHAAPSTVGRPSSQEPAGARPDAATRPGTDLGRTVSRAAPLPTASVPPASPGRATSEPRGPRSSIFAVDLARDERRGGHTIARHVGRTDAQLQARLARERIAAASTYADLETAEQVVSRALAANERRVQRWLAQGGPRTNLAIRYRARDGLPTGRLLRRGQQASVEVSGAVVVLRWRDDEAYVLTSYPEEPR